MIKASIYDQAYESPAVAFNAERREVLVVWVRDPDLWANGLADCDQIRGRLLSENGVPIGPDFAIASAPDALRDHVDVAYNPAADQYLVVWQQENQGMVVTQQIRGQRLDQNGTCLDGDNGFEISAASTLDTDSNPAVAYASTSDLYMVVWQEFCHVCPGVPTDIKGRTVDRYKGLGGVFVVSQDPGGERRLEPDLAYNRRRNECLVVWEQENGNDEIMARRVNAGGTPLFPESIPISVNADAEHSPAVGAVPDAPEGHYLVVWERNYNDSGDMDIRSRAVAGGGTPGPSIYSLAFEGVDETQPAVTGNERSNRFLVTWAKDMGSGWTSIYAAEADTSGWRVGTAQSCGFSQGYVSRSAVADGPLGDYLVVYRDAPFVPEAAVYGRFWGIRVFLPATLRNAH